MGSEVELGSGKSSVNTEVEVVSAVPLPSEVGGRIVRERVRLYGNPQRSWDNVGLAMHAMLQEHWRMDLPPLPGWLAALLLAQHKVMRFVKPTGWNREHADDLVGYTDVAFLARPEHDQAGENTKAGAEGVR